MDNLFPLRWWVTVLTLVISGMLLYATRWLPPEYMDKRASGKFIIMLIFTATLIIVFLITRVLALFGIESF
jgi:hypothetical protein